jgi:hypothetical protein
MVIVTATLSASLTGALRLLERERKPIDSERKARSCTVSA